MNKKILKFHFEEIIFVLMILATDLSLYPDEDLLNFAEAIHRLDTLAESEFLKKLVLYNPRIDDGTIAKIIELQNTISILFDGGWYKSLAGENHVLKKSNNLSRELLFDLKINYVEPNMYAFENMDLDL